MSTEAHLSRRERQIMDALHQRGHATAAAVQAALPEAPGYSAVRALLRILEDKGHVKHRREGARYVYLPRAKRETCLLYTSPSPRDRQKSRMPSSA